MKHRITDIKNRTIHIEDCLTDLKRIVEELEDEELAKAINTSKELQVNETFMADGTVNEIDDEEATEGSCKYVPLMWAAMIGLLILTIFLSMSE